MAKKSQILGNDPFRRGAADRSPKEPASAAGGDRAARKATPSKRPAPRPPAAQTPESAANQQTAKAAPGPRTAAKRQTAKATPNPRTAAKRETAKASPSPRAAAKRETAKAAPGVKTGAQPEIVTAPVPPQDTAAETGSKVMPSAEATRAAPKRAPVEARREAGSEEGRVEAGLLPGDDGREPKRRKVVAVPPIAAAAGAAPLAALQHPTGLDVAYGAFTALRQALHLPGGAPSLEVDEFGYDPPFAQQVRPFLEWIYQRWFRVESSGFDSLPRGVPLVLVANRAGAIPWDSLMLSLAASHGGLDARPLVEDSIFHFPSVGLLVNRLGAVRACPENAERLLARGAAVAVFPEGATGFGKPFRERYRLQRFGRGGFIKLALRTGALVVPISIVGSEEIHPLLGKVALRPFGFPFLPITPTFPLMGAAGLLPLPTKWRIEAGEPFDFRGYGPQAAGDDPLVMRLAEEVRGTIQTMLDTRLVQRRSVFR